MANGLFRIFLAANFSATSIGGTPSSSCPAINLNDLVLTPDRISTEKFPRQLKAQLDIQKNAV